MVDHRWNYKTLNIPIEKRLFFDNKLNDELITEKLNQLGDQGWELVSVVAIADGSGYSSFLSAFLKRLQTTEGT